MRAAFPRVYRSFEEFEREELRKLDGMGTSIDDMLDELFAEELDFDDMGGGGRGRRRDEDEDEDEDE